MYLTHKDLNKYFVIDIEADSLTPTVIWCVIIKNVGTKQKWKYTLDASAGSYPNLEDCRNHIVSILNDGAIFVGHNILSYDVRVLNRLLKTRIRVSSIVDTLVLSYLYHPVMEDGHSLEAWGVRLKFPKGDYSDFSQLSPEMLTYCEQDVDLTEKLFLALTRRMKERGFSERSCELEHNIRFVVDKQEHNGFYFDIPRATSLLQQLRQRQDSLALPIQELFPPTLNLVKTITERRKADGSLYKSIEQALERYGSVVRRGAELDCYAFKEFNIGSPQQRVQKLLSLGWEPEKYTKGGFPQADEESLIRYLDKCNPTHREAVGAIAEWLVTGGRANMLNTWLNNVNYTDSCMHGKVFTCGASTRRMTHSGPNTANIPKAKPKIKYGREVRSLWMSRPGRVLVGYDAKSLEMLMFCHYLGNPAVTDLYIKGDPHQANADAWGNNPWNYPVDRDGPPGAKTGFYAGLYGAMDPKLGDSITASGGREFGAWARRKLYETTPGLEALVESINGEYKASGGWLRTIDGGFVRCTARNAALNYKCQSAGGLVMKQASIFIDRRVVARGLDSLKVGDIHDEGQHDVSKKDAEEFGKLAVQAIRDAGEELGFSVPLDGDYKIGPTWADTH